jgi:hypothetical protein
LNLNPNALAGTRLAEKAKTDKYKHLCWPTLAAWYGIYGFCTDNPHSEWWHGEAVPEAALESALETSGSLAEENAEMNIGPWVASFQEEGNLAGQIRCSS